MRYTFIVICLFLWSCESQRKAPQTDRPDTVLTGHPALVFPPLPQTMTFAGQTVHLEDEDIRERLDREVLLNAYYQSATTGYFKRAHRYFPLIERILKEEGIPDDFKYLAVIESGLQQAVSPVGAQGFWQFMPATAKLYDLEMTSEIDERLNIEKSTRAACQYLKKAKGIWATGSSLQLLTTGAWEACKTIWNGKEPSIISTPTKTPKQDATYSGYWL